MAKAVGIGLGTTNSVVAAYAGPGAPSWGAAEPAGARTLAWRGYSRAVSVPVVSQGLRSATLSRAWFAGTLLLSLGSFAVTIAFAPPAAEPPARGLQWLLFVGSSVHVAATGWFYSVPEVRRHALANRQRYVVVPIALILGTAAVAALLTPSLLTWLLLAFFAWQFFHFQKQNLGMVALCGVSRGVGSARRGERAAIAAAGIAGTVGILAHPELLALAVTLPDALRACLRWRGSRSARRCWRGSSCSGDGRPTGAPRASWRST